ncbi:hypothetical protein [Flavobacterium sp. HNIBRBA15423]|uniref:hypothetical protein n=1 Tax=Flavobacterium sp. HNIBRBA15423 TaxID=3458683 RepID=UPI004043F31D
MNHLEKAGKTRTILISISILMVSLHTIYIYNSVIPEIEPKKIIQQIIRFLLTIGLLLMIYKGKSWARIIAIILFVLGILGAVRGLLTIKQSILLKSPFIVMLLVYTVAIYHFWLSKSFKAFFNYQNRLDNSESNNNI